jgi:DNA recombination protein RmuC
MSMLPEQILAPEQYEANEMESAQKNIQTGLDQLDDTVGRRTKAIQRKLRNVESLGEGESKLILPESADEDGNDDENKD